MTLDRAAIPFATALAGAAVLAGLWNLWAALPFVAALAFILWFFRDPERTTPNDRSALISPADGKVIRADARRISVFMNVFDVHVCRTPAAGRIASIRHEPGKFLAAFKDEASEHNERTTITVDGEAGRVAFTLVAGLVARRIVCRVTEGRLLAAGERVGLIRFGSRVDVDLPSGAVPAVRVGDRVVAGETILARIEPSRAMG